MVTPVATVRHNSREEALSKRKFKEDLERACVALKCRVKQVFEKAYCWHFRGRRGIYKLASDAYVKFKKGGDIPQFLKTFVSLVLQGRTPGPAT